VRVCVCVCVCACARVLHACLCVHVHACICMRLPVKGIAPPASCVPDSMRVGEAVGVSALPPPEVLIGVPPVCVTCFLLTLLAHWSAKPVPFV
jgi:hypothetical protein